MTIHFDIKALIANLPEQARRTVLYGLVGSFNARIIGAASRMVDAIKRNDSDVGTEIKNDFSLTQEAAALAVQSGNSYNTFEDLVVLNALRDDYQALLALEVNDKDVLPFGDTLKFMTSGEVRAMPKEVLEQLATALDCGITAQDLARLNAMDQTQQRAQMAAKSHDIMDIVMALPRPGDIGYVDYDDNTDMFDALSPTGQESVMNKLAESLNKARDNVLLAIMRRSRGASLSDIPLINAAMKEVDVATRNAGLTDKQEEAHKADTVAQHNERLAAKLNTEQVCEILAANKPAKAPRQRKLQRPKTGEVVTA